VNIKREKTDFEEKKEAVFVLPKETVVSKEWDGL